MCVRVSAQLLVFVYMPRHSIPSASIARGRGQTKNLFIYFSWKKQCVCHTWYVVTTNIINTRKFTKKIALFWQMRISWAKLTSSVHNNDYIYLHIPTRVFIKPPQVLYDIEMRIFRKFSRFLTSFKHWVYRPLLHTYLQIRTHKRCSYNGIYINMYTQRQR